MFKRILATALCVSCLGAASASAADEYKKCLDANYMDDRAMTQCNEDEYNRELLVIGNVIGNIAKTPYYANWIAGQSGPKQQATDMLSQWKIYVADFCDFYAYVFTQGEGTIYPLQYSQCQVDEAKRFLERIRFVNKIYEQNKG